MATTRLTRDEISTEDRRVNRRQAERIYQHHSLTPTDLTGDLGSAESYSLLEILAALGY